MVIDARRNRLGLAAVISALLVLTGPSVGWGAKPIPGGGYAGDVRLDRGARISIRLNVANDGMEFVSESFFSGVFRCTRFVTSDGFELVDSEPGFRSVRISPAGTFHHRDQTVIGQADQRVVGRFVKRGRQVLGSLFWPRPMRGCPDIRTRFRASLVGRATPDSPDASSRCDRVIVGYPLRSNPYADEAYELRERGIGCTTAREYARRWHAAKQCRQLAIGAQCAIRGALCQAIAGWTFAARALAAECRPDKGSARWSLSITRLVRYDPQRTTASRCGRSTWTARAPAPSRSRPSRPKTVRPPRPRTSPSALRLAASPATSGGCRSNQTVAPVPVVPTTGTASGLS